MSTRDYESTSLVVHWDAEICSHSGHCAASLPGVFRPGERPWIDVAGASDDEIAATIDGCPSGALSYTRTDDTVPVGSGEVEPESEVVVRVWGSGPYEIVGKTHILDNDGNLIREVTKASLCRCGLSKVKPFCDGSHKDGAFADPGFFRGPRADQ